MRWKGGMTREVGSTVTGERLILGGPESSDESSPKCGMIGIQFTLIKVTLLGDSFSSLVVKEGPGLGVATESKEEDFLSGVSKLGSFCEQ